MRNGLCNWEKYDGKLGIVRNARWIERDAKKKISFRKIHGLERYNHIDISDLCYRADRNKVLLYGGKKNKAE